VGPVAAAAGLAVTVGAVVMLVALVAGPGSWLTGYVSEAGTAGRPYAYPYRWGLILLAGGVALLGLAMSRRAARPAAVPLLIAAVLAGTSGAVACTDRCPLPPYDPTTPADLVHGGAGVLGMIALAAAMAAVAWADPDPVARRLARAAMALTVPLGAVLGLTMLLAGRDPLGAALERILLVVAVTWLVGTSVTLVAAGPRTGT
jgi:uncharacterized protein DUF998